MIGDADVTTVQTDQVDDDSTDTTQQADQATDSQAAAAAEETSTDVDVTDGGDSTTDDDNSTPESYADFDMPEGVTLDDAALKDALPLLKEANLSQEQAQQLVTWYAGRVQADTARQVDSFNELVDGWLEQSKADKEFGGDKFDESIGVAQQAVAKLGTPELKQLLDDHGVGNHPEVIRFMVRVGKLTQEDVPGGSTAPSTPEQNRVDILYPQKSA